MSLISDIVYSERVSERGIEFLTCSSSSNARALRIRFAIRAFYPICKRVESSQLVKVISEAKSHFASADWTFRLHKELILLVKPIVIG